MNANPVSRQYDRLTAEERFRLIAAAGARGDEAEQDRLAAAGDRISLSMPDHSPFSDAFKELALAVFIELVEEAAKYDDAWERVHEKEIDELLDDTREPTDEDPQSTANTEVIDDDTERDELEGRYDAPTGDRLFDLVLAQGFMLKTKADGWKLFGDRLSIPPFALWQGWPGFDRLQRALEQTVDNEFRPGFVFLPKGMLKWLNQIRPKRKQAATADNIISSEGFANDLGTVFRQRVGWCVG